MLYIMRHGKTDWNAVHRLQGSEDIPLNEEGRQMARDARKKYGDLRFDICYCSPLLIVAHGALDCSLICQYEEIPLEHFWDQLLGNCELRRLVSSANV